MQFDIELIQEVYASSMQKRLKKARSTIRLRSDDSYRKDLICAFV